MVAFLAVGMLAITVLVVTADSLAGRAFWGAGLVWSAFNLVVALRKRPA